MYISIYNCVLFFSHVHVHLDLHNYICIIRFNCDSPGFNSVINSSGNMLVMVSLSLSSLYMTFKPNVEVKEIKAPAAPEKKGEEVCTLMWLFYFYGGRSPEKCCSCKLLMHLIQWHGFKRKTTLCMFL